MGATSLIEEFFKSESSYLTNADEMIGGVATDLPASELVELLNSEDCQVAAPIDVCLATIIDMTSKKKIIAKCIIIAFCQLNSK